MSSHTPSLVCSLPWEVWDGRGTCSSCSTCQAPPSASPSACPASAAPWRRVCVSPFGHPWHQAWVGEGHMRVWFVITVILTGSSLFLQTSFLLISSAYPGRFQFVLALYPVPFLTAGLADLQRRDIRLKTGCGGNSLYLLLSSSHNFAV